MEKIIKEITKLTEEWYFLIGKDHHKEKDCHWYINTEWSYGGPPKYFVRHWGYILDDIEEDFNSYEEALVGLKNILIEKLKEEIKWQQQNDY